MTVCSYCLAPDATVRCSAKEQIFDQGRDNERSNYGQDKAPNTHSPHHSAARHIIHQGLSREFYKNQDLRASAQVAAARRPNWEVGTDHPVGITDQRFLGSATAKTLQCAKEMVGNIKPAAIVRQLEGCQYLPLERNAAPVHLTWLFHSKHDTPSSCWKVKGHSYPVAAISGKPSICWA